MCGRFSLTVTAEIVKAALGISVWEHFDEFKISWNIAPSHTAPSVYAAGSELRAENMIWGLPLAGGKERINIRAESIIERGAEFGGNSVRCLIPFSAYYEWQKRGSASIPHRIYPADSPVLFLAGLCSKKRFAVITADATPDLRHIHRRMPLITDSEASLKWLSEGNIKSVLSEPPPRVCFTTVSQKVNSPLFNSPECARPFAYPEQGELSL
jgi:putative SOS response-associated peptidase YedK